MDSKVWLRVEKVLGPHNAYPKIVFHFNLFQMLSFWEEKEYLGFWFFLKRFCKQYTYIYTCEQLFTI